MNVRRGSNARRRTRHNTAVWQSGVGNPKTKLHLIKCNAPAIIRISFNLHQTGTSALIECDHVVQDAPVAFCANRFLPPVTSLTNSGGIKREKCGFYTLCKPFSRRSVLHDHQQRHRALNETVDVPVSYCDAIFTFMSSFSSRANHRQNKNG